MVLFQSAHGQVVAWCKYSNSETDDRIASSKFMSKVRVSRLLSMPNKGLKNYLKDTFLTLSHTNYRLC